MIQSAFRLVCATALLLMVVSCASLPSDLKTPELDVVRIEMQTSDMFAQRFKIRLHVQNPNDLEVPVKSLDYKLFLMGDTFGEGKSEERFVLPAHGEAEFDMVLTTNFVSSLGRLISRMGGGKLENVEYEIAGTIALDKGFIRKLPFNYKGQVDFGKILGAPKQGSL